MALLVIGAVALRSLPQNGETVAPSGTTVVASLESADALLARSMDEAAKGNFNTAREMLASGMTAQAGPETQGRLQLALANLEYGHGERYAEAFSAYEALREKHFELFSSDPVTVQRFEVLAECAELGFSPLYALDAARNSASDPLPALENLVAAHPEKKVALLAILAMESTVQAALPKDHTRVAALQAVRERCANAYAPGPARSGHRRGPLGRIAGQGAGRRGLSAGHCRGEPGDNPAGPREAGGPAVVSSGGMAL